MRSAEEYVQVLVRERDGLLGRLRAGRDLPDLPDLPVTEPWAASAVREVSGRSAQTVLLVLGGLLVSVAALVFTVVSWGSLGLTGRTVVLLALTGCALALPPLLRRRGLDATAEAAGAVGLGLVLLDCLAARAAGLFGSGVSAPGYWAGVTAAVSAGALAYGWALRLRFPLAAGFLLTALPVPLLLVAGEARQLQAYAAAFVGAAAVQALLLWGARRTDSVPAGLRQAGAVLACGCALLGSMVSVTGLALADGPAEAAWAWAPLGLLAVLGLAFATRYQAASYVTGAALVLAAGGTLRPLFAPAWVAVAFEVSGLLVLTVGWALQRLGRSRPGTLSGVLHVGACTLPAAAVAAFPVLVRTVLEPLGQAPGVWARTAQPAWHWQLDPAAFTALALLAGALVVTAALWAPGGAATATKAVAVAAGALGALTLSLVPVASGLPYRVAVATALAAAAVAGVAVLRRPAQAAPWAGVGTALLVAVLWASADRAAAITVLGLCAALGAALARRLAVTAPGRAAFAAATTVLALGAEAAAVTDTAGLGGPGPLFAVLGVAVATVPVATRTAANAANATVSRAVEGTGYALAALALLLTAPYHGSFALALAVCGVAALAVALRADRRPAAQATGAGLLIASSWTRLALWEVHTPEAYTLTVAAAALTVGHLRHRREPAVSSWRTYGPGLGAALLPSTLALWSDGHWLRPLLLGCGALAVTVGGVVRRRQAPVVLGGGALLLTALHELTPTVVQVLGLLPRWAPLATAGLLLLALGARYERRVQDTRRLHQAFRRLG